MAGLKPKAGTVYLDGHAIGKLPTREVTIRLGILPQSPIAPEGLTVADLVARGRNPHQRWLQQWSADDESAVTQALGATSTLELATRPVDELSGGQRQRAWIAMALAQGTPIMLLDKPTTLLDLAHQVEVLDLLARLNREEGRTVVLVLHDLNQACRYAHHLVAMVDGAIAAEGPPAEVVTEALVERVRATRAGGPRPHCRHAAGRARRPSLSTGTERHSDRHRGGINLMTTIRSLAASLMAAALVVLPGCGDDGDGPGADSATEPAECNTVGTDLAPRATEKVAIDLRDFSFSPATVSAKAGVVTFTARNAGSENHELAFLPGGGELPMKGGEPDEAALERAGAFELEAFGPAKTCDATYELKPGAYTLFCIVTSADGKAHYDKGMRGQLVVR